MLVNQKKKKEMRKDDILSQKLFEVCTLSQFYLDRVMNCDQDGDSPFMLASAYKKKLNEIVDRYDKMKDVRQQLLSSSIGADEKKQKRQSRQIHRDSYSTNSFSSTPTRSPASARNNTSAPVSPSTSFASIKQFYEQSQQLDEINTSLNGKVISLVHLRR